VFDSDFSAKGKLFGRLVNTLIVDEYHAGHDHRLRSGSGLSEAALNKQLIDTLAVQGASTL
jgi:hypothetical protein